MINSQASFDAGQRNASPHLHTEVILITLIKPANSLIELQQSFVSPSMRWLSIIGLGESGFKGDHFLRELNPRFGRFSSAHSGPDFAGAVEEARMRGGTAEESGSGGGSGGRSARTWPGCTPAQHPRGWDFEHQALQTL
jgi:hypothetical protein